LYISELNKDVYGIQTTSYDFWAFTCRAGVKAVTDFWIYRYSHSWKEIKVDCLMDFSDIEPYHLGLFDFGASIVDGIYGVIHNVSYNTDSPHVTIQAELALQAGDVAEDANYWVLTGTGCAAPNIGAQSDFTVEQDDTCPAYNSYVPLGQEVYRIVLTFWPGRVKRGHEYTIKAEIWDADDNIAIITTTEEETGLRIATPITRDRFWKKGIAFIAGEYEGTFKIRGGIGKLSAPVTVSIRSNVKTIRSASENKPAQRR